MVVGMNPSPPGPPSPALRNWVTCAGLAHRRNWAMFGESALLRALVSNFPLLASL